MPLTNFIITLEKELAASLIVARRQKLIVEIWLTTPRGWRALFYYTSKQKWEYYIDIEEYYILLYLWNIIGKFQKGWHKTKVGETRIYLPLTSWGKCSEVLTSFTVSPTDRRECRIHPLSPVNHCWMNYPPLHPSTRCPPLFFDNDGRRGGATLIK